MKICPWCETGYHDSFTTCPIHGGLLSEIRDLRPGMLIRNTYRIVRKLSRGGMGDVYLATQILLNEPQVLKFLSGGLGGDEEWANRFLREVRTLRQIRHKNVINAGNLEPAEDGTLFFSMEYVEGPDLLEFYRRAPKPFDVKLALGIARGIAEGLGAAHALGVVHRDIKPENILMAREGEVWVPKIADFGIAATRDNSRLTLDGTALLTPHFAAPEQWMGAASSELDGRTDLYALGGVVFEMLTGKSGFEAENFRAWGQKHLNTPHPAPSSLRPELKDWRGLDELVLRLLAKERDDRPRNVAEMLTLLDAVVYEPLEATPVKAPVEPDLAVPRRLAVPDPAAPDPAGPAVPEPAMPGPAVPGPAAQVPIEQGPIEQGAIERVPIEREPGRERETAGEREPILTGSRRITQKPAPRAAPRPARWWVWVFCFAILILLVFAAKQTMVTEVHSITLTSQNGPIFSVAFSSSGLYLASASSDNSIQLWNVADGRPLGTMEGSVTALAFSPDSRTLASGMADNTIMLWDTSRSLVLSTMQGQTGHISALAFSPDGRTLASGSWDTDIDLWDVAGGRLLSTLHGHTGRVLTLTFSSDGHLLASAGEDHTIRFWNPDSGKALRTLAAGTRAVNSIAFSSDGRLLASGSDDATVKLWNAASGQPIRTLQGSAAPVLSVAFSFDGRILASGSSDGDVRLWDVPSGRELRTLTGHRGPVLSVAFSPFGYTLASGGEDRTIRLWDVSSVRQ